MRLGVLISGSGAFSKFLYENLYLVEGVEITLVIAESESSCIEHFKNVGIPTYSVHYTKSSKSENEKKMVRWCQEYRVDFVLLNFNRLLGPTFLDAYQNRVINLHLSTLPLYKGFNSIKKAYNGNVLFYGATTHLVDETVDGGAILSQVLIPKMPNTTIEEMTQRLYENACLLLLDLCYKLKAYELLISSNGVQFVGANYNGLPFIPELDINYENPI